MTVNCRAALIHIILQIRPLASLKVTQLHLTSWWLLSFLQHEKHLYKLSRSLHVILKHLQPCNVSFESQQQRTVQSTRCMPPWLSIPAYYNDLQSHLHSDPFLSFSFTQKKADYFCEMIRKHRGVLPRPVSWQSHLDRCRHASFNFPPRH